MLWLELSITTSYRRFHTRKYKDLLPGGHRSGKCASIRSSLSMLPSLSLTLENLRSFLTFFKNLRLILLQYFFLFHRSFNKIYNDDKPITLLAFFSIIFIYVFHSNALQNFVYLLLTFLSSLT